jgi:hypothetical protein
MILTGNEVAAAGYRRAGHIGNQTIRQELTIHT